MYNLVVFKTIYSIPILNRNLDTLQIFDFLKESENVDDTTVTNNALGMRLNDTNRNKVEGDSLAFVNDSVSSISTTSSTTTNIISIRLRVNIKSTCHRWYQRAFPYLHHPTGIPSQHQA